MTRTAVIVFPASNCDRDAAGALERVTGTPPAMVWHANTSLPERLDLIVVPGGFSYGDYLRAGAIAARSPVMRAVADAAAAGTPVLGVCNGFQILTEAQILPGALVRNQGLEFICEHEPLIVENAQTIFTRAYAPGQQIRFPIAHNEGCYVADDAVLERLEGEGRIAFRYADNPNGSRRDIAGIVSEKGNVLGLMPHPERVADKALGRTDGLALFESVLGAG